jgi:two-component system, NarL family, nitrate/nitrite sensor histidine kinase NarX
MNLMRAYFEKIRKFLYFGRPKNLNETSAELELRLTASEQLAARANEHLEAIFEAGQKFNEAIDEKDIIEVVLKLAVDLTGVSGISFVPLDEYGQPMAATSYGKLPFPVMKPWLEYLASPAVRGRCQICSHQKELTASCPLLKSPAVDASSIYCLRLRHRENEYGVFNLYIPDQAHLDAGTLSFIGALTEQTALAIEGLRLHKRELAARNQMQDIRQRANLSLLLNSLVEGIHQSLGADFTILTIQPRFTFSGATRVILGDLPVEVQPFVEVVLQGVSESGKSFLSGDPAGALSSEFDNRTFIAAGLETDDFSNVGSLLVSKSSSQGFTQNQLSVVQKVADQLALVVESTNLIVEIEYQAIMQERSRLAREIHDGLAQTLGYLKLQAAQMKNYIGREDYGRVQVGFEHYYETLSEAYQDARSAIDGLRLRSAGGGVQEWLDESINNFREISGLVVVVRTMSSTTGLPSEVHAQLLRIVQEAFNNVRKHAHAQQVWVDCFERDHSFYLQIQDDGDGFTPEDIAGPYHHGLQGMKERAELIGADFQVISRPREGTTIILRLPIQFEVAQEIGI